MITISNDRLKAKLETGQLSWNPRPRRTPTLVTAILPLRSREIRLDPRTRRPKTKMCPHECWSDRKGRPTRTRWTTFCCSWSNMGQCPRGGISACNWWHRNQNGQGGGLAQTGTRTITFHYVLVWGISSNFLKQCKELFHNFHVSLNLPNPVDQRFYNCFEPRPL